MRALLVMSALTFALVAGCTDAPAGGQRDDPLADPQYEDERGFQVDRPTLPTGIPAPGERTLEAPPQLRLGEWWRIRVTEHFTGASWEITRVVAGTERGQYLVGFPVAAFSNDTLVMHFPGMGDVLTDLSYTAHDVPFVPVRFPVTPGTSWTTSWQTEGGELDLMVDEVRPDGSAVIVSTRSTGTALPTTIVYDPALGEVRSLVMEGYGGYEVVEHGYGYNGTVRVPHDHDLVMMHGRLAGVHDIRAPIGQPRPMPPTEDIEVASGYDRISFAVILADIPGAAATEEGVGAAAGAYSVRLEAPDGTVYEDALTPADGTWMKASFHGSDNPAGTWRLQAVAAGAGLAFVEGIGYHSIDIELPSGCVVESANAGHHGTLCRA